MLTEFTTPFVEHKEDFIARLVVLKGGENYWYTSYDELFKEAITLIKNSFQDDYYEGPDPERITVIDHGGYQGTLLLTVAEDGYQPSRYWATSVSYGSCSYCDTLEAASKDPNLLYDLTLQMLQGMKEI